MSLCSPSRRRPSHGVSLLRLRAGSCSPQPALVLVPRKRFWELWLGCTSRVPGLLKATAPEDADLFSSGWSSACFISAVLSDQRNSNTSCRWKWRGMCVISLRIISCYVIRSPRYMLQLNWGFGNTVSSMGIGPSTFDLFLKLGWHPLECFEVLECVLTAS